MDSIVSPIIRWDGNKSKMLQDIYNNLPIDFLENHCSVYVEPFVGSGSVLLMMLSKFSTKIEHWVISDKNKKLINLYQSIKFAPDIFIKEAKKLFNHYDKLDTKEAKKEYYLSIRNYFNSHTVKQDVEGNERYDATFAAAFFFLNWAGKNSLYRENDKGDYNQSFGYKNEIGMFLNEEAIYKVSDLLKHVTIHAQSFEDLFKHPERGWFFYFDPPRIIKDVSEKKNTITDFSKEDQILLRDLCRKINSKGGKFIVNLEDNEFTRLIYKDFWMTELSTKKRVNKQSSVKELVTELLIKN